MKYISKILISEYITNGKNFLALLTHEIEINVTRIVSASEVQQNIKLPSISDINSSYLYLRDKREYAFQKLSDNFNRDMV